MIRKCFLLAVGILLTGIMVKAQVVRGKIVDASQVPVEAVTVVMQTIDSTFIDAVITDTEGNFTLKQNPDKYRLICQHLLFRTQIENVRGRMPEL